MATEYRRTTYDHHIKKFFNNVIGEFCFGKIVEWYGRQLDRVERDGGYKKLAVILGKHQSNFGRWRKGKNITLALMLRLMSEMRCDLGHLGVPCRKELVVEGYL